MENLTDILEVEGVNAKGFGTIPKLVMKDSRLTIQAKAIYAYFCSYAGSGNTAFPGIKTILEDLQVSKNTYYKHFDLLKECGYIKVDQEKNIKTGQFKRNIYRMVANPVEENSRVPKIEKREKTESRVSKIEKRPCTKICDTNINTNKRININNKREREDVAAEVYFDNQKIIKAMNEYLHVRKQNGLKTTSSMMIDWAEILHSRTPENAEETLKIATASNWPTITKDANMKKAKQCNKTATTKQAKGKYTAPSYNHAETDWSYLEM